MDYRTAAALSQNLAGIGDMFMQMNDPANRAKAALVGNQNRLLGAQVEGQNIENQYRPGLFGAQTDAARGSAASGFASGRFYDSKTQGQGIQNKAGQALLDGYTRVPTTSYSLGGAAGPDEMTDQWTEKGFSSTGRNLSEGIVAVNPSVYPIGTVFKTPEGKTLIAADKHGNANPNVVDIYRDPQNYQAQSGQQNLQVVGQEKIPYGTTPEQLAALRAKYEREAGLSNIFAGGGAADLATGTAKMAALNAPDEISARRALAAQGVAMNQGEYFEPGKSDAFQGRALLNNLDQEGMRQVGNNQRAVFEAMTDGTAAGSSTGTRGKFDAFDGAKEISGATVARFSLDGETIGENDRPKAQAWAASVSTLTNQDIPFEVAKSIADAHHGLPKTEDGWFSAPSQNYAAFNATPITPEQAAETATRYGTGGASGPDMQRIMSAAQIFGSGAQPVAAAAQPPAATQQAPAAVPQTGVDKSDKPAKASDAFKPKEGSKDEAQRKDREKKAAGLKRDIADLTKRLEVGEVSSPAVGSYGSYGGYGGVGLQSPVKLNNDGYNVTLNKLKTLEAELAALESHGQPQQGGVRQYNPTTGNIE